MAENESYNFWGTLLDALFRGGLTAGIGALGGAPMTGESGGYGGSELNYPWSEEEWARVKEMLFGALEPLGQVSYGGIKKPVYDTTKLKALLGLGESLSRSQTQGPTLPAKSGWLPTALMTAASGGGMDRLLGDLAGSAASAIESWWDNYNTGGSQVDPDMWAGYEPTAADYDYWLGDSNYPDYSGNDYWPDWQ